MKHGGSHMLAFFAGALLAMAGLVFGATIATSNPSTDGSGGVTAFPHGAIAVTPSDTDVFASPVTVYVGVTGNVRVVPANGGSAVTFVGVPAGGVVPVKVRQVYSTSTTATSIVAVF